MLLFASSFFVKRRSLQLSHSHLSISVFLEVMFMFLFAFYLVHQKCASPRCVSMNQRLRGIIAAHVQVADRKCVFLSALLAIFLSEHGND